MQYFLALNVGLVIWIVLWAVGVKGLDAFFIPLALILLAVIGRAVLRALPSHQS